MNAELKKTMKAVTLELRHLLEGRCDSASKWLPGDLEQRLARLIPQCIKHDPDGRPAVEPVIESIGRIPA